MDIIKSFKKNNKTNLIIMKLNTITFVFAFLMSYTTFSQSIVIEGPGNTCPNDTLIYNVYAENIFGKLKGDIRWEVYLNGTLLSGFGNAETPFACPTGGSSENFTITINEGWGVVGNIGLKVYFMKRNDPFCNVTEKTRTITSTVPDPGLPATSTTGELVFCSANETKTVFLNPGMPDYPLTTDNNCNYHYGWDWEAPSGWIVKRESGSGTNNNVQTNASEVVLVTSPSSLQPGAHSPFTVGPYATTLNPFYVNNWIDPRSRNIWVGTPAAISGSVSGPSSPTVGSIVTYSINASLPNGAGDYKWVIPYNLGGGLCQGDCWQLISDWGNSIRVKVGSTPGYVQVMGENACGTGGSRNMYITPSGGGGGIPQQQMAYPNPSSEGVYTVNLTRDIEGSSEILIFDEIHSGKISFKVHDETGNTILESKVTEEVITVDLSNQNKGTYYLRIYNKKSLIGTTRLIRE